MFAVDTRRNICFIRYMASKKVPLATGEYYHVFNRGVAKMRIFNNFYDYNRFLKCVLYYQIDGQKPRFSIFTPETYELDSSKKIVDIISYCFMPNHFHFMLKQTRDGGISEFISKISNSYTKYFNIKNARVGPILQGDFKAVHIESNEQLLHVTRYIHLNPLIGFVVKDLEIYKWSSYSEYTDLISDGICEKDIILGQFETKVDYKQFVLDHIDYAKRLDYIKHLLLDYESGWV